MSGLDGGVALVTGGSRRIGAALVRALAGKGNPVAIHYHVSAEDAEVLAKEIRDAGGTAMALNADLSREEEVHGLVDRAADALGPCQILVNNASHFQHDTLLTHTRDSWDAHMEPNLRAPMTLSRAFAEALPTKAEGLIVNILDQRIRNLTPNYLSYSVSKAGLWAATRVLALSLAPQIRVNAIGPGPTLASESEGERGFRRERERLPLTGVPDPSDVASVLLYLVEARAVTGQIIFPDGGQHLGWHRPWPEETDCE